MRPRLFIGLSNFDRYLPDGEWKNLVEVAAVAESAGIDGISVVDHVVLGGDLSAYPYGSFPGGPADPWLEPLTTLAAIAGRTSRLFLMTGILIAPLRPAPLLAKIVATLDQLSAGRLELGVGTGWLREEYEALGLRFAERGRLLDMTLEACQELWRPDAAGPTSAAKQFSDVHCSPRPVRPEGVPIWIGGELHKRNLDRIVKRADGWIPAPRARSAEVAEGTALLRAACAKAGRDPRTLKVRVSVAPRRAADGSGDVASTFRNLPAILESTGATDVFVPHAAFSSRFDGTEGELFGRLAEQFAAATS